VTQEAAVDVLVNLLTELYGADHPLVVALAQRGEGDRPWASIDDDALAAIDEGLRALAADEQASADLLAEAVAAATEVRAETALRAEESAAEEARRAEAVAALTAEPEAVEAETPPAEIEESEGDDEATEPEGTEESGDEATTETEPELVTAAVPAPRARRRLPATRITVPATAHSSLVAAANVAGFPAGSALRDWSDLAKAFQGVYDAGKGSRHTGAPEKKSVASTSLPDLFTADRFLSRDVSETMRKFNALAGPEALTASGGICGPLDARFEVISISDDRRPIRDALPRFGADRGGVRFMQGLEIEDYAAATEVWTEATDAAPGQETKNLLTATCGTEQECLVSAITARVQFGNFMGRFSPEWVAAITDMVMSAHARLAEDTLWNTICTGSIAVTAGNDATDLGAVPGTLAALDRAVHNMRSRFRMPPSLAITALMPDALLWILRADAARRAPGDATLAVLDAQIEGWFRAHGVNPVFSPDGGGQVVAPQAAGALIGWPDTVEILLFPTGTWVFLDGGELDLGVVRDSTLNGTNDFQTFSETFENACLFGVPSSSWCLTLDICPDGTTSGPNADFDPCGTLS
jgi:hypothetical protein